MPRADFSNYPKLVEAQTMKRSHRRQFLRLTAGTAALPVVSRIARAQTYPMRPVRIIVGYAAGGGNDISARLMGQWLSDRLGQQFVIDNRLGAGSNIATEVAVKAPPDGNTLLLATTANAINATLYEKLNFNFVRDVTAVASIIRVQFVMAVNPSVPAGTVPELISYTKANPGKITIASAGIGSSADMAGELFKMMNGVNMVHVPYRGAAPAITDLLGGQVQVFFAAVPEVVDYVKAGRLRALAVTTTARAEALPDVPTVGDFVPGFETSGWNGLVAPKNTPVEIIEKLSAEINAALQNAKLRTRLVDLGFMPFVSSSAEFSKFIVDETEKWAKVIKFSGAKPE